MEENLGEDEAAEQCSGSCWSCPGSPRETGAPLAALRSLRGRGGSVNIPRVWVCFPCSSGDTLPAAPPPPPPASLLVPSRRGRPPTAAAGAMTASAGVQPVSQAARAPRRLSGSLRAPRGAGLPRLLPAEVSLGVPWALGRCRCRRGEPGRGVPGWREVRRLRRPPAPALAVGAVCTGAPHTRGRACGGSRCPQGRAVPVAWRRLWPHPARSVFPSLAAQMGLLVRARCGAWGGGLRWGEVTPLPSSSSPLPPPPPAVFFSGNGCSGAAAALPRPSAGSESGGAVRRAPDLPLPPEQQSLPFPTVVCCHDLLLSV